MSFKNGFWVAFAAVALIGASIAIIGARAEDDRDAFIAVLSGGEEVPMRDTHGRGVGHFLLSEDGTSLSYRLIVANIENVFQAHIHLAPAGVNGGVVVWLYPSTTPGAGPAGGGRIQGVIAEGTITAANFVGGLAGHPFSDLITAMQTGGAYVNVHTNDGDPTPNEGAGDFPGGEIRGQIRVAD